MERLSLKLGGLSGAGNEGEIVAAIARIPGVVETSVNIALARATIVYNEKATGIAAILQAMDRAGYQATPVAGAIDRAPLSAWRWQSLWSWVIFGWICYASLPMAWLPSGVKLPLFYFLAASIAQIGCGGSLMFSSWQAIRRGRMTIDLAICIHTSILYIYATMAIFSPQLLGGDLGNAPQKYYLVSTLAIAMAIWSKRLEVRTQIKAAKIVDRSVKNSPYSIRIIYQDREIYIPIEQVQIGDLIQIERGEIIPIDGKVTQISNPNSPWQIGDLVRAGSKAKVDSMTIAAIATKAQKLLPTADRQLSSISAIADRWIGYLLPLNLAIVIATGIYWWQTSERPHTGMAIAIAIIAIGCPSCFALAVALGRSIGLIRAAKVGMSVKNGMSLELASRIKTIVCEPATLLENSNSIVTDFIPVTNGNRQQEIEVLQLAASLAYHSDRPTAGAIVRYAGDRRLPLLAIEKFQETIDLGSTGIIDGKSVRVGTIEWIDASSHIGTVAASNRQILLRYERQWRSSGKTVVWIEIDGELVGAIAISDEVAIGTQASLKHLKLLGIEPVLLTDNNRESADRLAKELGIDRVFMGVNSSECQQIINELQAELSSQQLVGRITKDTAERSISIGIINPRSIATTSEIELRDGDLFGAVSAIRLSRWTNNAIVQNLSFAVVFPAIALAIVLGWQQLVWESSIDLWLAVIATLTSSLWICANSYRLLARRSN